MSKGNNQKLKLSYLRDILLEKTDDEHSLTMQELLLELEKEGITAERKSVYTDIEDLNENPIFDMEVSKDQVGRQTYYHVTSRTFELAEIKLLIDAIQSSKFITEKKSRELIEKIKKFVSRYEASSLQRQVYVHSRIKTMNESIYYNVDNIHNAIAQNRKITFKYYMWNVNRDLIERNNGNWYTVSPWALSWDDENYYLVAFDDRDKIIKHYRVDKMMNIIMTEDLREGKEKFKNFDMAIYSKMSFGMYHGEQNRVELCLPNEMVGIFIDRFGKDIIIRKKDDRNIYIQIDVVVSPQFYGWVFGLGKDVEITAPESIRKEFKETINSIGSNY